jgi:hypothetical protein
MEKIQCRTTGLDTTLNSPFKALKRHFDNSNQGVNGVANLILKSKPALIINLNDLTVLLSRGFKKM